jgi:cytochrome c1
MTRRWGWLALAAPLLLASCARDIRGDERASDVRGPAAIAGGDPERGRAAIRANGCGSCHTIPGVTGATALVGPPLTHIAQRVYIAGVLPNTTENMVRWLLDPPAVDSLTAMPNLGLRRSEAHDIAAYLYSLD